MNTRFYLAIGAIAAAGCLSGPAQAEHWDVIASEMTGDCTVAEYLQIVDDFNVWAKDYGYSAKVAMPIQADDVDTFFWVGSSANAATFGAAWDAYRDAQADPDSEPAILQVRFDKCAENESRSGYDVYN